MSIRANVRSFLVPLTMAELQDELDMSVAQGDAVRAGYIEEFIRDVEADFSHCDETTLGY